MTISIACHYLNLIACHIEYLPWLHSRHRQLYPARNSYNHELMLYLLQTDITLAYLKNREWSAGTELHYETQQRPVLGLVES